MIIYLFFYLFISLRKKGKHKTLGQLGTETVSQK